MCQSIYCHFYFARASVSSACQVLEGIFFHEPKCIKEGILKKKLQALLANEALDCLQTTTGAGHCYDHCMQVLGS